MIQKTYFKKLLDVQNDQSLKNRKNLIPPTYGVTRSNVKNQAKSKTFIDWLERQFFSN